MDETAQERSRLVESLPFDRKELARRAECSTGTLSDWINNKRQVKKHLHDAIMREISLGGGFSGIEPLDSESVSSGIELREQPAEYQVAVDWRERALKAEAEIERLRSSLHELTKPVTYGKNIKKPQ